MCSCLAGQFYLINSQLRPNGFFRRKRRFVSSLDFCFPWKNSFCSGSIAKWRTGRRKILWCEITEQCSEWTIEKKRRTRPKRIRMRELKRLQNEMCYNKYKRKLKKTLFVISHVLWLHIWFLRLRRAKTMLNSIIAFCLL